MDQYATYCPEDNKLRLYVGRVPREEYLKLRAEGWTSTPKQDCNFVAVWTPQRRDTALEYGGGIILDEDQSPEDRAADRAERFGGYRDKRESEALGHADRYDAGPSAHGYQSQAKAERMAARHDRIASHACDAWSKAEYWQRRTAGVIRNALYKSSPGVRMGRIKTLEAELRKAQADIEERTNRFQLWQKIAAMTDPERQTQAAISVAGSIRCWSEYPHPVTGRKWSLYSLLTDPQNPITGAQAAAFFLSDHDEPAQEDDWSQHYKLRLAYENQMLEAQGGRAAFVEMEVGGWIGNRQIRKVNKSNATGRVVSVTLKIKGDRWGNSQEGFHLRAFNIERLPADAYRPPTAEDLAALAAEKTKEKAAAPKKDPCPLINPTDADAERLQAIWNDEQKARLDDYHRKNYKPSTVCRMTQAEYSARSGGSYSHFETVTISEFGTERRTHYMRDPHRHSVFKVRKGSSGDNYGADRVVVLTDKPQKSIPWAAVEAARAKEPTIESMTPRIPEIQKALNSSWLTDENRPILNDAAYVGWVWISSMTQFGWTDAGLAAMRAFQSEGVTA